MAWIARSTSIRSLILCAAVGFSSITASAYTNESDVFKHEAGRCSIRGQCKKGSFFSGGLPCPDNGLATEPEVDTRKKLVDICGPKWNEGAICCDDDQVSLI